MLEYAALLSATFLKMGEPFIVTIFVGAVIRESTVVIFRWATDRMQSLAKMNGSEIMDSFKVSHAIADLRKYNELHEEERTNFKSAVVEIQKKVNERKYFIKMRLKDDPERYILYEVGQVLNQILTRIESREIFEKEKQSLRYLLLKLNELESGYNDILHCGSEALTTSSPPWYYYMSLLILPVIAFHQLGLSRLLSVVPSSPNLLTVKSPPQKSMCPQGKKLSAIENQLKIRLMSSIDDDGFKQVLTDNEINEIKNTNRIGKDFPETAQINANELPNNLQNDNTAELLREINSYQKLSPKLKIGKQLHAKLDRIKPLLYVFHNNARVHSLKPQFTYQVAIAVPFGPKQEDGPLPWSLGVLRGVDIAQRKILDSKDLKAAPKVVIVNDYFNGSRSNTNVSPLDLSDYLSSVNYDQNKIIALIGHMHQSVSNNSNDCYEEKKLPVLTNNILPRENLTFVQSLLPNEDEFARKILKGIEYEKHSMKYTKDAITVFFDSNDSSSQAISDSICKLVKSKYESPSFKQCTKMDVSMPFFSEKLNNDKSIFSTQPYIALNPFMIPSGGQEPIDEKTLTIFNAFTNNDFRGTLYVGHNFVDEDFLQDIDNQINRDKPLMSNGIAIKRFGPWDWRAKEGRPSPMFEKYHKNYGQHYYSSLNWYAINAINSMLLFQSLIADEVLERGEPSPDQIRKNLEARMTKLTSHGLPVPGALPNPLRIFTNEKSKHVFISGNGTPVCLVNMLKRQTENARCYD